MKVKSALARSNRGQASIMIGMMMLTFLLFFTFVVNTGMLVSAKINLQNAADLAAYAGAATQARQLNSISFLNYEMRRQYKKFLFRYYVMGNIAQKNFPNTAGSKQAHVWSPNGGSTVYGVPAVCLIFNSNDNYCQVSDLPRIPQTPSNPADLINSTLNQQLAALETIRELNCGRIAQANVDVLLLWLYNTDPTLQNLPSTLSDPNAAGIITVTQAVAQGLGLVPREIILNERINTLKGYVNSMPLQGVTLDKVNSLKSSNDPAANERTIQAFLSAYYTLGQSTFDDQYVQMDELMPVAGDGANLLALKPVQGNFDTYAVGYQIPTQSGTNGDCVATLLPIPVKAVPLGVQKDPSVLTYYAVRLKAQAQIMFSPFGAMNIKAYSAARPFGSRLGPAIAGNDSATSFPSTPTTSGAFTQFSLTGNIPNLPVWANDTSGAAGGWDTDFMLGSMYAAMFGSSPPTGTQSIGSAQAQAGYNAAMVPNPAEGSIYNVMSDEGGQDAFVRYFDTNHQAKFWAPVFPPGQQASLQEELRESLQTIFGVGASLVPNQIVNTQASNAQLESSLFNDLLTYINLLPNQQGENGEGMNVVAIQDPFSDSSGNPITLSPDILMNNPMQYKTSWVTTNSSDYTQAGRVGYSVKFVSFDSLTTHKTTSDGTNQWTNGLVVDDEASADGLLQIQH